MKAMHTARTALQLGLALGAGLLHTSSQAVEWPSRPLSANVSAKPMTMLIAGRDHKFFYEAYNDASDLNPPVGTAVGDGLDLHFKPNITYYGLYDSSLCYTYTGNNSSTDNAGLFSPASIADTLGRCVTGGTSGEWSGNWLNYVTTSRIDALRKVLYGGMRDPFVATVGDYPPVGDTATRTILRRSYIPQDAHSWGKEYHRSHGYLISQYTDLADLTSDTVRHFFGNLTANNATNCSDLRNCSDLLPPLLRVRANVPDNIRIWQWASKERPVLANRLAIGTNQQADFPSAATAEKNFTVRVEVCTATFNNDCRRYPNGQFKPIGVLHEYGENNAMLFGLITGSYDQHFSGGRLRKNVSSFADEVNPNTGQFRATAAIVNTFNRLRIRGFNQSTNSAEYWKSAPYNESAKNPTEGELVDWGSPVAEMMYEAVRYFAGKTPTSAFNGSTTIDDAVGFPKGTWDDPYDKNSTVANSAKASFCARPNLLAISDIYPSYDSDQLPGSSFNVRGTSNKFINTELTGLNVTTLGDEITAIQSGITGKRFFVAESGAVADRSPTPKTVTSLGNIRGLSPEEPTKDGSYYAASVAYYAKTKDLRAFGTNREVYADTYAIALSSPLPRIVAPLSGGRSVSLVPFAKTIDGLSVSNTKGNYQPTNQIVDFYIESIANSGPADQDASINGGRYQAIFQINFEDVEQGGDHDMDAIAEYEVKVNADDTVSVRVTPRFQAGSALQAMGYVVSGTNRDGTYLVAQDQAGNRQYFLNVPTATGLPGMCDVTTPPAGCNRLPTIGETVLTYTFTPSATAGAGFLKDPLWYAAKFGGFVDRNKSKTPDLAVEWDANADGVPDTYFLVQNPLTLRDTLRKAFNSIIDKSGSGGNISSNSTELRLDTRAFQAKFNALNWSGELEARGIDRDTGVSPTAEWLASDGLPDDANRRIFYTSPNTSSPGGEFTPGVIETNGDLALFNGNKDLVSYLRGARGREFDNGGPFRSRGGSVLGDIAHSSPVYEPKADVVYVGSNGGMLHAFNAKNGKEIFAFIPKAVMPQPSPCAGDSCLGIKALADLDYDSNHRYFVDGEIAVSNVAQGGGKNILVGALGRGGKGLFALDVTNPAGFDATKVLWENYAGDPDMGYILGRPIIVKVKDGVVPGPSPTVKTVQAVIVGNGYNSRTPVSASQAALLIFNLETGALIRKITTGATGDNGLSTPGVIDSANDGIVDFAYAGDLQGNVWKFDLSNPDPAFWGLANGGSPFYIARNASAEPQPITAPVRIVSNFASGDPNFGKRFIHFGTGSYFRLTDPNDPTIQSWYGLIDEGTSITTGRTELVQRTMSATGTFGGRDVRTFSAGVVGDTTGRKGWFLDLPVLERIITASNTFKGVDPTLNASIVRPEADECSAGGQGFVAAVNPFTGTALKNSFFDVNNDKSFLNDVLGGFYVGAVDLGVGMPGEAILIGNRLVVGGSSGTMGSIRVNLGITPVKGRLTWREIVRD